MTHQVSIQCLEYEPLIEVLRLVPEIPVGYLTLVNAAHPGRLKLNFLSDELSRLTGAFLQAADRCGEQVHVWTVDAPADTERMIDFGADDLIRNEPAEALRRVRAYESLNPSERKLRRAYVRLPH